MTPCHPTRLLARLGISDRPAGVAVALVICLQYVFLAALWMGYPIRNMGDIIHGNVVVTFGAFSILGATAIGFLALRRWSIGMNAAMRLERPASNPSFDAIRAALATVSNRSTLRSPPTLLYTPKNADALEVRERASTGEKEVVVGLEQRTRQSQEPEAFAAMLGHEISHLELAGTRIEIRIRRAVILHLRILAWLVGIFLLLLGFIDLRGLGIASSFGGFVPVFNRTLYTQLGAHILILAISSAIVLFIYSYFLIVRREHAHDLRGSQLAGTRALIGVFLSQRANAFVPRVASAVRDFFTLHPSPSARVRVLEGKDLILLSTFWYPVAMSTLVPLVLLFLTGWRGLFGGTREIWNVGSTVAAGLFLYAVLRADLARLGLGLLLDLRRYIPMAAVYASAAAAATQIPRTILEILYGLKRGLPIGMIFERIWSGGVEGGVRSALMFATTLGLLSYLNAVRIAATGEANAGKWRLLDGIASAMIVTGAFIMISLQTVTYILVLMLSCAVVAICGAAWFAIGNRCNGCSGRRLSALRLSTQCRCGREQLPMLRWLATQPFESQLSPRCIDAARP